MTRVPTTPPADRIICYHGTNWRSARQILRDGFSPGTYFALHLEDAVGYGGPYVFEVDFPASVERPGWQGWQFTTREAIPSEHIVSCKLYSVGEVESYPERRLAILLANSPEVEHSGIRQDYQDHPEAYR